MFAQKHRPLKSLAFSLIAAAIGTCFFTGNVRAEQQIILKSGITERGILAPIATLDQNPFNAGAQGGKVKALPLLLVDDGLRRVYLHRRGMVNGQPIQVPGLSQTILLDQPVPRDGQAVQGIGTILGVSRFNQFGRRTITVRGPKGAPLPVFQGISELTTRYAKLEALKAQPSYKWDMRVSTRSIPTDSLKEILHRRVANQIGQDRQQEFDSRLEIVRFFIEAERYGAAADELRETMRLFPDQQNMNKQLSGIVQQQALQLLDEAIVRAEAGQIEFAKDIYSRFPQNQIGRVTALKVKDAQKKIDDVEIQISQIMDQLRSQVQKLKPQHANALGGIVQEIEDGLSDATLPRLSDFARFAKSDKIPLDNRVALAVAGWILGQGSGEQNLSVAISLITVRDLVAEYLGPADAARRTAILDRLRSLEGSDISYVSKMLPLLVPPKTWPDGSTDPQIEGMHRIGLTEQGFADQAAADSGAASYVIQLPPEYDPLREYPCILALHSPSDTALNQLDWWAGPFDSQKNARHGHATRNGYIVVAPAWSRPGQRAYEYTSREHQRVLVTLRDAMRRCSIDADRVFIVGHGDGGTAAWDIALSHPDHWAGMISLSGEPGKTIQHYFPTAQYVPMYLVMGEAAGTPTPLVRHGPILDKYVHFQNDVMVIMYRGRGTEYFYDEIQQMFKWMNASTHVRRPTPREFEARTMREGDQCFWWLELGTLGPLQRINPILWDQAKRIRAAKVTGSVLADNQIRFQGPCDDFTLWLRPDMGVDLNKQVVIRNGTAAPKRFQFDGNLETILEDTRQRADRKRPFWASVRVP